MGAKLAMAAIGYANATGISMTPRALLLWMALRALDDDSPTGQTSRRSFMRRSELGVGIGRMMPDREPGPDASAEARSQWNADDQAVGRALRELKRSGAIAEVGSAHNGRVSEFEICLGSYPQADQNATDEISKRSPSFSESESVGLRNLKLRTSQNVAPINHLMNHHETRGEQQQVAGESYVAAVDNSKERIYA